MKLLRALAVALPLLLAARAAAANGRYPIAGQIVEDPDDPMHLAVRATYGMMLTRDGGTTWGWVCEPSVGFRSEEDPMLGIAHGGNVLAAIFEGLSISKDFGCDFAIYPPLKKKYAVDLSVDKADPSRAVIFVSTNAGGQKYVNQLWDTSDGGNTWAQAGVNLPDDFVAVALDSAPSQPEVVYVSGRFGSPDYAGALEVTMNRGASWARIDIPGSSNLNLPYIAAVAPDDPGIVYVRLHADHNDTLAVTRDGGTTWKTVFTAKAMLLGFALSPDGKKVVLGSDVDGLWMADTSTFAFHKLSKLGVRCLTWTAAGIYACADEFVDGFEIGLSKDEGKTFDGLFHLQTLCSVLPCKEGSTTAEKCPDLIGAVELSIMSSCDGGGGQGGASASSGSASGSASASGGATVDGGGCGCSTPGGSGESAAAIAALGLLMLGKRARTARRRVRPSQRERTALR